MVLRVIDLFAGCGGLSAGLLSSGGFDPVAAVEIDRDAAATYAHNFGAEHVHVLDIAEWRQEQIPDADIVVGGPPCQGFSALGRRNPSDPRNALWNEYLRVLQIADPDFFVLENVPGFLRSPQFGELMAETELGGRLSNWALESHLLNSAHYGAAQARRRAVVIGRRVGTAALGPPRPWIQSVVLADVLQGVPTCVTATELPGSLTTFQGQPVPGPFKMRDLHVTRQPEDQSQQRFRAIPLGGNRFDLPLDLQTPGWRKHKSGSGDVMGRLHWGKPSVTIRTEFFKPEKGRYLHPEEHRPITHYEAALIQGFPDDFVWCGTKTSIARQIGNAVPVPLGRALGELLLERGCG